MRRLSLYAAVPAAAVEREPPRDLDPSCSACALAQSARKPCMAPFGTDTRLANPVPATPYQRAVDATDMLGGDVGAVVSAELGEHPAPTLLVIGEGPGRQEDARGEPFVGDSGAFLRGLIAQSWRGPVVFDNATRCYPGRTEVTEKHVDTCRGYLAAALREVQPARIVTVGSWSAYALMGRSIPPMSSRRAYAYLFHVADEPVPAFFVLHPAAALRNRFVKQAFQADLKWALTAEPPRPAPLFSSVRVVSGAVDAHDAVRELRAAEWAAFDVETAGVLWEPSFRLLSLAACAKGSSSPIVWDRDALADPTTRQILVDWLEDHAAKKLGQNVKFDVNAVRCALGAETHGLIGDTRLWRRLEEPSAGASLDAMAELVGMGGTKDEAKAAMRELVDRARRGVAAEKRLLARDEAERLAIANGEKPKKFPKLQQAAAEGLAYLHAVDAADPELGQLIRAYPSEWEKWSYALCERDLLGRYNGRDAVATARLAERSLIEIAKVPELDRVRTRIVDGASRAVSHIERWGVPIDRGALAIFDQHLTTRLGEVGKRIDAYGFTFNKDSPKQVEELLYTKLKLKPPPRSQTKSGANSTGKEVLAELAHKHPLPKDLLEWRKLTKLKGTYAGAHAGEGMLQYIRSDGRIHPSILLDGARSGRTSCQDPNLQNIPRPSTPEGKMARDIFAAPPGFLFLQLDYSQLELRLAALLSGDEEMQAIFASGADYHQRTAEMISQVAWGIPPSMVTKEHRSIAKTINFALLYGAGDDKIAEQILANGGGIVPKAQVARIREAILGKFRRLATWIEERLNDTRKTGVAWTWWDGQRARRRPLWEIADYGEDDKRRSVAEHSAWNTPIQGTGSDFLIASLVEAVDWIDGDGLEESVRLVLPVHDSMLFEVREPLVKTVARNVRDIMTGWNSGGVPLLVDVEIGKSWGSLVKQKEAA